ncbi:DUF866-domain-containing protein, partial [Lactifluus volemus]
RLLLSIKANLENVTNLVPASVDFEYFFGVKCTSCNEFTQRSYPLTASCEEHHVSTGKDNTAHFVWRCGLCKRESSAKFEASSPPQPYSNANSQFAPFLIIDCRGLEFISFDPRGIWKCEGLDSRALFTEVEFDGGEWVDYDEKAKMPVGISEIESQWSRA